MQKAMKLEADKCVSAEYIELVRGRECGALS